MSNSVLEFDFDSAEDFINTLMFDSSIKDNKMGFDPTNFVFRGERSINPDFKLLPSALRLNHRVVFTQLDGNDGKLKFDSLNEFDYISKEFRTLYNFYRVADRNGIALPEVQRYRDYEQSGSHFLNIHTLTEWLPDDLLEIAGIAQHYGIPTRLMDWSYNPLTALYFAATGAVEEHYTRLTKDDSFKFDTSDKIVIWALNARALNDGIRKINFPLKLVRPLYHRNPNLAAQHGVFTHWKIKIEMPPDRSWGTFPQIDRMPLDERLRLFSLDEVMLYKFMVPIADSNRVLSILRKLLFTASKIYPGLDGVARETNEFHKREFLHSQNLWPM